MRKEFLFGVLATIVVGLLCGYIILRMGLIPANADAKAGSLEKWAARTSLHATLDNEAPKGPNPVALTDGNLIAGIDLYEKRSEEHTSELQSLRHLVCRLLLEK